MQPLGDAGFSGAAVFRVVANSGTFCWRRWQPTQSARRVAELHQLLQHVAACGLSFVPVPKLSLSGFSVIQDAGALWQLETWMPGKADYWQQPNEQRLQAAFQSLAHWHRAAATIAWRGEWFRCESAARPMTVAERLQSLRAYSEELLQKIEAGVVRERTSEWHEFGQVISTALRWHGPQLLDQLQQADQWQVPVQPVIRDVWHDHVLFTGDNVTGLIDYGAARTDTVAADISRLLGSLVAGNVDQQRVALAAYESVRPLSLDEQRLIPILDLSNVLLSGLIWLRRRYVELEPLASEKRVLERLRRIAERLLQMR